MTNSILSTAAATLSMAGVIAQTGNGKEMKSINSKAPVVCNISITINADCKKVWSVMTNIDKWSSWQTDITQSKLNGELKPETTFDWKSSGAKIHSTLQTVNPNKFIVWTGKSFGILAIHTWTFSEQDGKTTVQVDESMEGLLASLLKKTINKSLEKSLHKWLVLLKQECEK